MNPQINVTPPKESFFRDFRLTRSPTRSQLISPFWDRRAFANPAKNCYISWRCDLKFNLVCNGMPLFAFKNKYQMSPSDWTRLSEIDLKWWVIYLRIIGRFSWYVLHTSAQHHCALFVPDREFHLVWFLPRGPGACLALPAELVIPDVVKIAETKKKHSIAKCTSFQKKDGLKGIVHDMMLPCHTLLT